MKRKRARPTERRGPKPARPGLKPGTPGEWKRRLVVLVLACLIVGAGIDASRAPGRQISTAVATGAIHLYQRTAAPILGRQGMRCRFTPTCSRYAEASLRRHGIITGGWRTLRRLARCGPWTPMGTSDPPE